MVDHHFPHYNGIYIYILGVKPPIFEHTHLMQLDIYIYGFGGITVPPVNGSEAVAFVSMPLKSIRVVADLAFLHNEQIMHCQMF